MLSKDFYDIFLTGTPHLYVSTLKNKRKKLEKI
jgi:hypothetical protein